MLANNHTHDYGDAGLLETLDTLDDHRIIFIGAGRDRRSAHEPLQIRAQLTEPNLADSSTPLGVSLHNVFRGGPKSRDQIKAYAKDEKSGPAQLLLKETEKINGRWVIHGVGNFLANSPRRYTSTGSPPYSVTIQLTFTAETIYPRLYPIVTDNRTTNYQPTLVSTEQFDEIRRLLLDRTNEPDDFEREFEIRHDTRGWHFTAQLRRIPTTPRGFK